MVSKKVLSTALVLFCGLSIPSLVGAQSCYIDPSCVNGGLGCNANGNLTCRYCGGDTYADVTCPSQLSNCCNSGGGGGGSGCPYTIPYKPVRTFKLRNNCAYDLYVGVIGVNNTNGQQWGPRQGGFKLPAGAVDEIYIGSEWSGRIWPRTNCRYNASLGYFQCDSGECWSSVNDNGVNGTCCGDIKCAGAKQTSVAEFSIAGNVSTSNDFYDVSLVDGYTIPMSVTPYDSDTSCGGNTTFYCQKASINELDVESDCPPELRWSGTGEYSNMLFCSSICSAVNSNEMIAKSSILSNWANGASAIGGSGTNYTATHHGSMVDFLCCQCGNSGSCSDDSTDCAFGCTPHPYSKDEYWPSDRICTVISGTGIPDWPYSPSSGFETTNYAEMFKGNSPTSYSWQFDDPTSTFQCRNSHYQIDFCASDEIPTEDKSATSLATFSTVLCVLAMLMLLA